MPYILLFIFGAIIGSFLNVVSLRYKEGGRLLSSDIIGTPSLKEGVGGVIRPLFKRGSGGLLQKINNKFSDSGQLTNQPIPQSTNLLIHQSTNLLIHQSTNQPNHQSTKSPPSHCPACNHILKWYELIPILSFIIQKGRCRNCKQKISWQYPIVEFLTGLIFVFIPFFTPFLKGGWGDFQLLNFQFTNSPIHHLLVIGVWLLIFILFILLATIDFRLMIIPDSISISLAILGILLMVFTPFLKGGQGDYYSLTNLPTYQFTNLPTYQLTNSLTNQLPNSSFLQHYALLFGFQNNIWLNHIFAALIGMIFFGLIIILSKGRGMGVGDLKLIGALGLIFGWPDILMVMALSFIIGAIVGVYLIIKKKKEMNSAIPFGPFLVIGAALVFFFGYQIIDKIFQIL